MQERSQEREDGRLGVATERMECPKRGWGRRELIQLVLGKKGGRPVFSRRKKEVRVAYGKCGEREGELSASG